MYFSAREFRTGKKLEESLLKKDQFHLINNLPVED